VQNFFEWKSLGQTACVVTGLYLNCPAREPEPHLPEYRWETYRANTTDWPSAAIPASGYWPG
jgi:hypothetical protein